MLAALLFPALGGCSHSVRATPAAASAALTPAAAGAAVPANDPLSGDIVPVHDPSLAQKPDGSWIAYTTDLPFLNVKTPLTQRCSADLLAWQPCGYVFPALPSWVTANYPAAVGLWAPEVSFFNGQYHLYYAVSSLGSQHSAIGLATNATLDPNDPHYGWHDQGPVLQSEPGGDFNAIDPSILVDGGHVWLTYGSFWGGIYQQEVDPATGKPTGTRWHLAAQPASLNGAIEGAAMTAHNGWYYLFASAGLCCEIPIEKDTYQQIVGRSRSPHGPFTAQDGGSLIGGGGTVLLTSDANWLAPGGGSLWQSADGKETLLTFHALHRAENGALYLWVERVDWQDDWPVLAPLTAAEAAAVSGASAGALRAAAGAF